MSSFNLGRHKRWRDNQLPDKTTKVEAYPHGGKATTFNYDEWLARQPKEDNTRMAGDALENAADNIIAELRGERDDSVIQNAMDDLYSLREINKDIDSRWNTAASQAGLSREDMLKASNIADNDIQLVGNISSNVPEALSVEYDSGSYGGKRVRNETRFHTKFEPNPVTGQMDVVPFVAKGETNPLITEFGLVGDGLGQGATEGMDSDEFLGKRILQLIGMEPTRNNNSRKTAVDLVDAGGKKVDVEILKTGDLKQGRGVGMQVYTQVSPMHMTDGRPSTKAESQRMARAQVEDMEPIIKQKMIDDNLSLVDAVDALTAEGYLSNAYGNDAPYLGKLFKEGGKYADNIVYPVMTNDNAFNNMRSSNFYKNPRGLVQPLEGAYYGDVRAAADLLNSMSGRQAANSVSVRPLAGNDNRTPSGKLYLQVPTSKRDVVRRAEELNPAVQQLYKNQQKKTPR